jgi:hypothetical protein
MTRRWYSKDEHSSPSPSRSSKTTEVLSPSSEKTQASSSSYSAGHVLPPTEEEVDLKELETPSCFFRAAWRRTLFAGRPDGGDLSERGAGHDVESMEGEHVALREDDGALLSSEPTAEAEPEAMRTSHTMALTQRRTSGDRAADRLTRGEGGGGG